MIFLFWPERLRDFLSQEVEGFFGLRGYKICFAPRGCKIFFGQRGCVIFLPQRLRDFFLTREVK